MENRYMKAQCRNMLSVIAAFSQACELAALEDDGVRSKTSGSCGRSGPPPSGSGVNLRGS